MKKYLYSLLFAALTASSAAFAQDHPDRMIVRDTLGQYKGFLVERVADVTFAKLEGKVVADLKLKEVTADKIYFTTEKSAACDYYKFNVIPATIANRLTSEAQAAAYIDQSSTQLYYEDFTNGEIGTETFKDMTDYVGITVGFDKYGIACGVSRAPFTTLRKPLVGNPKVTAVVDSLGQRAFKVKFTPNADVAGYATLAGKKGEIQKQYEQFAPMMGFSNFGEMVKGWGYQHTTEEATDTWKNQDPGTEYEVFVQAWDKNGTFADCDTLIVTTAKAGGPGAAAVSITLGDYKLQDWEGEQKPSQFITFTPNDQSSCYRTYVTTAEDYDKDVEGINGYVRQDPPMPIEGWFQYETITTDYQIDPNTSAVAVAAAKNSEGEWGEVSVLRFTTPAEVSASRGMGKWGAISSTASITPRLRQSKATWQPGTAPAINLQRGVKLSGK